MGRVNSGGFIFAGAETAFNLDKYKALNKEVGQKPFTRSDSAGNEIWSSVLTSSQYGGFYNCVVQSNNKEFIASGSILDYADTSHRLTISKYKNDGALVWNKNFGGRLNFNGPHNISSAQGVIQSGDGNYVAAGYY